MNHADKKNMININIQKARKNKKLTQAELAEILNVSRQTVSNWERGACVPDAKVIEDMQRIFDVSSIQLLGKHPISDIEENQNELSDSEIVQELAKMNAFYAAEMERRREQEQRLKKWFLIAIIIVLVIYITTNMYFRPTEIRISPTIEESNSSSNHE